MTIKIATSREGAASRLPDLDPNPMTRCLLAMWLLVATAVHAAVELPEPATQGESAVVPRFKEDAARSPEAPTASTLASIVAEDGPAAGVILAGKALAQSTAAYGPRDVRLSTPLLNQANARQRAGDYAGAQRDYRHALEVVEASGGPRDDRLFDGWYGLGYTQLYAGSYDAATESLTTALQLHRVNRGLYSAEQLDVLHALALSLRAQGKADDADMVQLRRMEVAQHVYGLESPDLARAYVSGGRWFRNVGRYRQSMYLHSLALRILEAKAKDDPRLIEPLIEIAISGSERWRDPDETATPGVPPPATALARAEKLAETRVDGSPIERAAALVRIGDVHYLLGRREPALRAYAKAAALLAPLGRQPPFAQPEFITFRVPRPAPLPEVGGYVLAEFNVETDGRVRDARIVETQPASIPPVVGTSLLTALKQARLRPQISNGQAVASTGVRYRLPVRGGSGP